MKKSFRLNLNGVDGTFVCGMASSGMCDGFLFLEQQMMTYSAVARGGVVRTSRTTAQKGTFMMLKCGSSSYFGEHENSRTCLGAHIAFSSAENQGVNQSQMNCS